MKMPWYTTKLRRTLMDIHIEDWHPDFLSQFDPEQYFASLCQAGINAPMIYIQSHVGYCYWPTRSGKMHRALTGREDTFQRLFELCHQSGMSVVAYYSLIYNNWAFEQNPAWRMRKADGSDSRSDGSRYGLCCPNNLDYRDFIRAQMAEFSSYFSFEGVFLDMTFWPMTCYCNACQSRWASENRGRLPGIVDWQDENWLAFQNKRQLWLLEFAEDMTAEMKKRKPGCSVEHQYSTALLDWNYGVGSQLARASDYAGGDLYGGIAQQSFACKLYYNLTPNQPFEYMTSRCYPSLHEHTSTKSDDLLTLSVMTTFLHHGACLLIDAIDPVGTHDERVYEKMGAIFRHCQPLEPRLQNARMVYDVGVYFNLSGKLNQDAPPADSQSPELDRSIPQLQAAMGAARTMQENKIPYGVIPDSRTDLLQEIQILVLPDVHLLPEADLDPIRQFIRQGGRAYLSGHSCWSLVEEILQAPVTGYTPETITYVAPDPAKQIRVTEYFSQEYPMAVFEPAVLLDGNPAGDTLARLHLPYTLPGQGPAFASIHSNPPGKQTDYPALVRTPYGQGEMIWSAVPFEKADRPQHRQLFADLIRGMARKPFAFSAEALPPVECILFDDAAGGKKLLGLLNLQESFVTLPVQDIQVHIQLESRPRRVYSVMTQTELPFEHHNQTVSFRIKKLLHGDLYEVDC